MFCLNAIQLTSRLTVEVRERATGCPASHALMWIEARIAAFGFHSTITTPADPDQGNITSAL